MDSEIEFELVLSKHVHHLCKNNLFPNEDSAVGENEDEFYSGLLKTPVVVDDAEFKEFQHSILANKCYPLYPLYKTITQNLSQLILKKESSNIFTSQFDELNEILDSSAEFYLRIETLSKIMNELTDPTHNRDDIIPQLIQALKSFTKYDWLKTLGLRRTVGSQETLPPELSKLWFSYQHIHHPKSKLTVGARALSKHCNHSLDNWWGNCTGTENNKNIHAITILKRILLSVSWINIHTLPHDVYVLEIRCYEGYGVRWNHDGENFRGFLEPQIVDGHEKGWVH